MNFFAHQVLLADVLVGGIRQLWLLLFLLLLLTGCDFGNKEREAAEAIYKANAEAAKQCEAKLRGLKRVPIAGTGGRLFLDAERLPMWTISRGFRPGDECAATQLGWAYEIFYWNGKEIIPQVVGSKGKYTSLNRPDNTQYWITLGALVRIGQSIECNKQLQCNEQLPPIDEVGVIRLKNYSLDAWPMMPDPKTQRVNQYRLSLRDWPMEIGRPRWLMCSGDVSGKTAAEIERRLESISCELDFSEFHFKAGYARVGFSSKEFKHITPALKTLQQYLNESIIDGHTAHKNAP